MNDTESGMTHASLFSGIGGFDLAAEWVGWRNVFYCEIDPFCRSVLKYHFPNAIRYDDIKTTDFSEWRGRIDVLSGGFPCQPFSIAGQRRGTEDDRYLWPEMLRAIREIRPRYVVGENVLGIVNWSDGLVFEQVCVDLETEGYQVQPCVLPACSVDAPHRRYRTWFVAHAAENALGGRRLCRPFEQERTTARELGIAGSGGSDRIHLSKRIATDSTDARFENVSERSFGTGYDESSADTRNKRWSQRHAESCWNRPCAAFQRHNDIPGWDDFPTQSPVCGGDDGIPDRLDSAAVFEGLSERQSRCRNPFVRWRMEAIRCYGNAIVPQVALRIFQTIVAFENTLHHSNQ